MINVLLISIFCSLLSFDSYTREEVVEILETYQQHYNKYLDTPFEVDSSNNFEIRQKLEDYTMQVYNPALPSLVGIICEEKDYELLKLYLETMEIAKGSANELPTYCLAEVFICCTDKTEAFIEKTEDEAILISLLEFGFLNVTYGKEESIENYEYLKNRIAKLKSKYLL